MHTSVSNHALSCPLSTCLRVTDTDLHLEYPEHVTNIAIVWILHIKSLQQIPVEYEMSSLDRINEIV